MTPSEINLAIAVSLGWRLFRIDFAHRSWHVALPPGKLPECGSDGSYVQVDWSALGDLPIVEVIPDYSGDEAAIRQALRDSPVLDKELFGKLLCRCAPCGPNEQITSLVFATAPQLCEAYLRSVSKWRGE